MKFALIGKNIQHSRSPEIYGRIIPEEIEYDLIDVEDESKLPSLAELKKKYRGINITSPYKKAYLKDVVFESPDEYQKAINCIRFHPDKNVATNTDATAIELELDLFKRITKDVFFVILGNGVMGQLTAHILKERNQKFQIHSRTLNPNLEALDLSVYSGKAQLIVVINTCAREFVFKGKLHPSFIFWDYNYDFIPHQNTLPSMAKVYHDGQRMLELQALAAAKFWKMI